MIVPQNGDIFWCFVFLGAEFASPEFDEFLDLLGSRVRLKGFERYRGGLDVKSECDLVCSFGSMCVTENISSYIFFLIILLHRNLVITLIIRALIWL